MYVVQVVKFKIHKSKEFILRKQIIWAKHVHMTGFKVTRIILFCWRRSNTKEYPMITSLLQYTGNAKLCQTEKKESGTNAAKYKYVHE
jgi:hypothetical protein